MKLPGIRLTPYVGLVLCSILMLQSCSESNDMIIDGNNIRIEFTDQLHSRVIAKFDGEEIVVGNYAPSEYLIVGNEHMYDFGFVNRTSKSVNDDIGRGKSFTYTGEATGIRKEVSVILYNDFPAMAVYTVTYTNVSDRDLHINGWMNNRYEINDGSTDDTEHPFWTFQGGSYSRRPDWVLPIHPGFIQDNFMGMNSTDYGGGTPVVDIWSPGVGIAVGHLETVPKLVSLPVQFPVGQKAQLGVKYDKEVTLVPGEKLETFQTFVSVHRGDFFQTLVDYRNIMGRRGLGIQTVHAADSYDPQWCGWGYERDFTMEELYGTLPMIEKLGYKWVVPDYGWENNVGDWNLNPGKFPRGDDDMIAFVRAVKERGLRAKLWWTPLMLDPASDLYKNHPEYVLLNRDGTTQNISFWNSYYLCPAYFPVQEFTKELMTKFLGRWGYEGLKVDGMHINAAPPCYNPVHNHEYPEESYEKIPEFFRMIWETAHEIVDDPLIELCPCGAMFSFFNMPYMTQGVASDPTSSWQVRLKGKTLKALMGSSTPYFGDHVELTTGSDDFASQVGIGAVIGTKFTWPGGDELLTPEKEVKWARWSEIYRTHRLSEGEYLGSLYDLGFDRPETHAIRKDKTMYYAFFDDRSPGRDAREYDHWEGFVELRGLEKGTYAVYDYVNDTLLDTVIGPDAKINIGFRRYLLLMAVPQ
jgi:alpha-galactosidase